MFRQWNGRLDPTQSGAGPPARNPNGRPRAEARRWLRRGASGPGPGPGRGTRRRGVARGAGPDRNDPRQPKGSFPSGSAGTRDPPQAAVPARGHERPPLRCGSRVPASTSAPAAAGPSSAAKKTQTTMPGVDYGLGRLEERPLVGHASTGPCVCAFRRAIPRPALSSCTCTAAIEVALSFVVVYWIRRLRLGSYELPSQLLPLRGRCNR